MTETVLERLDEPELVYDEEPCPGGEGDAKPHRVRYYGTDGHLRQCEYCGFEPRAG